MAGEGLGRFCQDGVDALYLPIMVQQGTAHDILMAGLSWCELHNALPTNKAFSDKRQKWLRAEGALSLIHFKVIKYGAPKIKKKKNILKTCYCHPIS